MSRRGPAPGAVLRSAASGIPLPADRRFRRPDSRPVGRRTRMFVARLWKPAAAVGLALAVVAGCGGLLLTAPALAVDRVVVVGHSRLSTSEVEARLDGLRGLNIFRVNLGAFRARVMESPWIADASIRRVLPSTVEVRVAERVPVMLARFGQVVYLMDGSGVLIDEFGPRYRDVALPIVDGLAAPAVKGGPRVDRDRAALASRFLASLEARPDIRDRVSQVNVSNARDVVVLLDDDAALLHLGVDRFVDRLAFYLEMSPTLGDEFRDIDYVDLRFDGRLVVRSRTEPASTIASRRGGGVRP